MVIGGCIRVSELRWRVVMCSLRFSRFVIMLSSYCYCIMMCCSRFNVSSFLFVFDVLWCMSVVDYLNEMVVVSGFG